MQENVELKWVEKTLFIKKLHYTKRRSNARIKSVGGTTIFNIDMLVCLSSNNKNMSITC